ncbi:MAG: SDR family oxidoreductase [Actinomycetia bacterium]|nr:SDR family oxidoreductase [Actinomycetes bacterium]
MSNKGSVSGLAIAVTGGARGIGREIAKSFVGEGARVAIADVDVDLAESTAAELSASAGKTMALRLDVTDVAGFEEFLDKTEASFGSLDVLVNNAGIMPIGPFLDEPDSITTRTIDIDVRAVLNGTKLAGRRFRERGSGHVVNVASVMGTMASPNAATYCAAKYALVGLGQALRQEWRNTGVQITTICPGFVRTELIAGMTANPLMEQLAMVDPQDVAKAVVDAVQSGGSGEVFVPKTAGLLSKGSAPLPGRLRDFAFRLAGGNKVTQTVDKDARASYQRRVAGTQEEGDPT